MAYTPPAWNAVALSFGSGYTPPAWNLVALEFKPRPPATLVTGQAQSAAASADVITPLTTAQVQSADAVAVVLTPYTLASSQGQTVEAIAEVITPLTWSSSQAQTVDAIAEVRPRRPVLFAQAGMRWSRGKAKHREIVVSWRPGTATDQASRLRWDRPIAVSADIRLPWSRPAYHGAETRLVMSPGDPVARDWGLPWIAATPRDQERRASWAHAHNQHQAQASLPWIRRKANDHERRLPWALSAPVDHEMWLATGHAKPRDLEVRLPWGIANVPPHQWLPTPPYIPPPLPPPAPPCYVPPAWNAVALAFRSGYTPPAWNAVPLAFACDPRIFRVARSLRLSHSLSVVRLPDRLPLHVTAVSMSTDRDSWAWSFQLKFADRASLLACAPSPEGIVSVEITLDGHVWVAAIEGYNESRELARKQGAATGRSRTALLAAPYDAERSYQSTAPATAQQLALRELDFSGFALDWQLVDWTALAGTWSYDRDTHMGAIQRIAAAAGGIVQAAADSDTVIVQPRHPFAPWEIASADVDMTIDASSCLNLGKRYVAGPQYQSVYVSGRDQGLRVRIRRDGTSGSPPAEPVIEPLISDTAPATSRGKSILTSSYSREEISLLVPLTPSPDLPGLLMPGMLLAVEDATWGNYRAVVIGVNLDAEISGDGALTARQSITVERYITA